MTVFVTGAAGFIGYHVCEALLARNEQIVGVDSMNNYYDVNLKMARLFRLQKQKNFQFNLVNLADRKTLDRSLQEAGKVSTVIHLAAQPGIRYSLENPSAYIQSNIVGHFNILDACSKVSTIKHFIYASSSSVYGGNTDLPYSTDDRIDNPISLYAATKRSNELISQSYNNLYDLPQTGLRFFTVYGPWGRPDMAYYSFTKAIFEEKPIQVFNHGFMKRDFTYIDDVVAGVLSAVNKPAKGHKIYNLGNCQSESLLHFIEVIEDAVGKKAKIKKLPMQPGDVKETFADIETARRDLGFIPTTLIDEGIPLFVEWF
ncbi:hypothetical protein LCGC14_2748220, partial [marine sediment metagenome]